MKNTVTVESSLSAYFKQPSGPSRPGVDWMVKISGEQAGMVIVRTYFESSQPQESEKATLANKASTLVMQKLEEVWLPEDGSFLELGVSNQAAQPVEKAWWKIFG